MTADVDPYVIPGTNVLRNRLGIVDVDELDRVERWMATQRLAEGLPKGLFDLSHLRAIHRHLFQDFYDWAGELRTVEISKGGNQFQFRQYITTGMSDVHRRLTQSKFLRDLTRAEFAKQAGVIIGDLNYIHPFREGNGRTQLQYLKQLPAQAGHRVDLKRINPAAWLDASKASHAADYSPMADVIRGTIADP